MMWFVVLNKLLGVLLLVLGSTLTMVRVVLCLPLLTLVGVE
jgi:hypothetical protein